MSTRGVVLVMLVVVSLVVLGFASAMPLCAQEKNGKDPSAEKKAGKPKPKEKGEAPKPGPDELFDKQLRREIDAAIERGVAWLLGRHKVIRSYSLSTLALLKCGVSPDDPAICKAFKVMRDKWRGAYGTYAVGILLMALEAKYYNPSALKKHYKEQSEDAKVPPFRPKVARSDYEWARELAKYLIQAQKQIGGWGYSKNDRNNTDNSCSQFACLGLLSARRLGVPIPEKVFLRALDYWLGGQCKGEEKVKAFPVPAALIERFKHADSLPKKAKKKKKRKDKHGMSTGLRKKDRAGFRSSATGRSEFTARGWDYASGESIKRWGNKNPYGNMTAAGLASLVICKSELIGKKSFNKNLRVKTDLAIEDGAAWLARNVKKPIASDGRNIGYVFCYYMYSLERAGILSGCEKFGEHEWYREGAIALLKCQEYGGCWNDRSVQGNPLLPLASHWRGSHSHDTCFALLSLARATMPVIEELDRTKLDRTIYTGRDLFKKKGKKEDDGKAGNGKPEDSEEKTAGKKEKLTQEKVGKGTKLAVEYLLRQQQNDGSFGEKNHRIGCTTLAAVALLKGGLSRKHPAVRKALECLSSCNTKTMQVHEAALVLMALEAAYCGGGVPQGRKVKTPSSIRKWAKKLAGQIVEFKNSYLYYPQYYYACMGLKAARRLGIKIPDSVFVEILQYWWLGEQCKEGEKVGSFPVPAAQLDASGFKGVSSKKRRKKPAARREFAARGWRDVTGSPYGSTAAGLATLVICKSELAGNKTYKKKLRVKTDEAIEDAAAWLAKFFSVKDIPSVNGVDERLPLPRFRLKPYYFFYMFALENAGTLTGCEKFGEHDWYREGALALLAIQKPDGHWDRWLKTPPSDMQDPPEFCIANTCFALLFLKKATIPVIDDETLSAFKSMEKQKQEEGKSEPEPGEPRHGEKKAGENNNK